MHDPDVLILDEPTDGLDPIQKYEMRDLIRSIAPRKAIIISTHILEEVEAVCTRAIIIAKGRMLADATPAELLARAPVNGTLALALATADPQQAIEIISQAAGRRTASTVAQRVNGVTRLVGPCAQRRGPRSTSSPACSAAPTSRSPSIYLQARHARRRVPRRSPSTGARGH